MKITADEVRRTAALARLALDDDEAERMTRELDAVLEYMERLAAVDVTGVPPMTHAVALTMPLREDAVGPQLPSGEALAAAPRREEDFFQVPRIIDKTGSLGGEAASEAPRLAPLGSPRDKEG